MKSTLVSGSTDTQSSINRGILIVTNFCMNSSSMPFSITCYVIRYTWRTCYSIFATHSHRHTLLTVAQVRQRCIVEYRTVTDYLEMRCSMHFSWPMTSLRTCTVSINHAKTWTLFSSRITACSPNRQGGSGRSSTTHMSTITAEVRMSCMVKIIMTLLLKINLTHGKGHTHKAASLSISEVSANCYSVLDRLIVSMRCKTSRYLIYSWKRLEVATTALVHTCLTAYSKRVLRLSICSAVLLSSLFFIQRFYWHHYD